MCRTCLQFSATQQDVNIRILSLDMDEESLYRNFEEIFQFMQQGHVALLISLFPTWTHIIHS